MLTVRDVAMKLNVCESSVYGLIESGRLACHRIANGRGVIRVHEDDLETYLASCRVNTTKESGEKPVRIPRRNLRHIKL